MPSNELKSAIELLEGNVDYFLHKPDTTTPNMSRVAWNCIHHIEIMGYATHNNVLIFILNHTIAWWFISKHSVVKFSQFRINFTLPCKQNAITFTCFVQWWQDYAHWIPWRKVIQVIHVSCLCKSKTKATIESLDTVFVFGTYAKRVLWVCFYKLSLLAYLFSSLYG